MLRVRVRVRVSVRVRVRPNPLQAEYLGTTVSNGHDSQQALALA